MWQSQLDVGYVGAFGASVPLVHWYICPAKPVEAVSDLTCSAVFILSFQLWWWHIPDRAGYWYMKEWHVWWRDEILQWEIPWQCPLPQAGQLLQLFLEQCFTRTPGQPACSASPSHTWVSLLVSPAFLLFPCSFESTKLLPSLLIHRGHDHRVQSSHWTFLMHIGSLLI